jgi:integrating conjugative element membrane protein (TIGR03747 family)
MDKRWDIGFRWWIKCSLIILLATLGADYIHVLWPYPNGAIGVDAFKVQIRDEWTQLLVQTGGRIAPIANGIHDALYTLLYRLTGIDYLLARASDPTPLDGGGEMMRRGVMGFRPYWETAQAGLQLFSVRLATLALATPMIGLIFIASVSDGLVGWYRRRTGGDRESGFVFHRAKWLAGHTVLIFCFVYLVPPVTVDPRIGLTTFALILCATVRIATASFKKYI